VGGPEGDKNRFQLWDAGSGKLVRHFTGHAATVNGVAFAANGTQAWSYSRDGTLRRWDLARGKQLQVLGPGEWKDCRALAALPSGRFVLTGWGVGGLALWELATGREVLKFEDNPRQVTRVAISPDGRRALSIANHAHLILWDLHTGEEVRTLRGEKPDRPHVWAVEFSPDGQLLATAGSADWQYWQSAYDWWREAGVNRRPGGGIVTLFDFATGRVVRTLRGNGARALALAFLPGGKDVLVCWRGHESDHHPRAVVLLLR
jgi:WD40 repeat protein